MPKFKLQWAKVSKAESYVKAADFKDAESKAKPKNLKITHKGTWMLLANIEQADNQLYTCGTCSIKTFDAYPIVEDGKPGYICRSCLNEMQLKQKEAEQDLDRFQE